MVYKQDRDTPNDTLVAPEIEWAREASPTNRLDAI